MTHRTIDEKGRMVEMRLLPVVPLRGVVFFPGMFTPLEVGRAKSVNAVERAALDDSIVLLVSQKDPAVEDPSSADLFEMGCAAEIKQSVKGQDGTLRVLMQGINRAQIVSYIDRDDVLMAEVRMISDPVTHAAKTETLMRMALGSFETLLQSARNIPSEVALGISRIDNPAKLADEIAPRLPLRLTQRQSLLDASDVDERLEKLIAIMETEKQVLEIEQDLQSKVRKQIDKSQKEYYLREQMRVIQKELGEEEDKEADAEAWRKKLDENNAPEDIRAKAEAEIKRLKLMGSMAPEATVSRTYIDWLTSMPWGKYTEDSLDLKQAKRVLDEDHWGLEKVKERILEFLAVRKLSSLNKGPILCLVGPPGVGKTSLAKSVARSLNRKFVRFSLGGLRDEAEIRGHRRTYIGALPGKLAQALKQAGSANPVILLDEIDKLGSDWRGDPSSAMLEVLDPEQNKAFLDHYMEVPLDLSKVMFITTANSLHNVPRPLADRMEIIDLSGYTEDEKLGIAKQFLIPKQKGENGLADTDIDLSDETVLEIVRKYTREAGVRELERQIGNVMRKMAWCKVSGEKPTECPVRPESLHDLLGVEKYRYGVTDKENKVGVSTGLAWTETGGDILFIETTVTKGSGKLTLTGQMGDVMKESAQAAYTYVRSRAKELGIDPSFHETTDVHIHVPEGAIPKDGPSAGIAMATSLASALSNRAVRADVAMTGEITLRGRVLPIGGLKEKSLAAMRAGIRTVIIPADNHKDMESIPQKVKEQVLFIETDQMDKVLENAMVTASQQEVPAVDIPVPLDAARAAKSKRMSQ